MLSSYLLVLLLLFFHPGFLTLSQLLAQGLAFLGALKTQALDIVRKHYRELLSPDSEYENQEGYWQLIAENVSKALKSHSFLQASASAKVTVGHLSSLLIPVDSSPISSPRCCLTTQPSNR